MENYPLPNQIYQHYKGGTYQVISLATHTETSEVLVIYRSLNFGSVYARPISVWNEFKSGVPKFKLIDKNE